MIETIQITFKTAHTNLEPGDFFCIRSPWWKRLIAKFTGENLPDGTYRVVSVS